MNTPLWAAAALAVSGLAGQAAWAQSSVTLYGVVDAFASNVKSGGQGRTAMADGGDMASRIGFRGTEDLGGGHKVSFVLEQGLSVQSGQSTGGFTRQSFLSMSGPWGALAMGRMYTPLFNSLFAHDPFSMNAVYTPLNLIYATDAQTGLRAFAARADNLFRYSLPAGMPISGSLAYAPGTTTTDTVRRSAFMGGNLGWKAGGFSVAYGFQRYREGAERTLVEPLARSTYHALSASYTWSKAKLTGHYIRNSSSLAGVGTAQLFALEASYTPTPVSTVLAGVTHRKVGDSARSQNLLTLGYNHNLSKRTVLYGRFQYLDNRSNASATVGGAPMVANSGHNVRMVGVGIRHSF